MFPEKIIPRKSGDKTERTIKMTALNIFKSPKKELAAEREKLDKRWQELAEKESALKAEKTAADIKRAVTHMSGKMRVGAGTVTTVRELMLASGAGAEFIISPNTDPLIIGQTKQFGMISIPGAFTPSEVVAAEQAGADYVKLFPVSSLGPEYAKSILAPLNGVKLLAVGGVSREDTGKYLDAGCVGFGVGGGIANRKLCEEKRFDEIAMNARLWADAAGTGENERD